MVVNVWLFIIAVVLLMLALLGVLVHCLFDAVMEFRHNKAHVAYMKKTKPW